MATQALMFNVGTAQSAQIPALAGKSYVVGQVTSAGAGLDNLLFLTPVAEGGKSVALKIEGTRQIAELSSLAGKTITVGKSPTVIGGMSNWLVVKTGGGATATAAAGGAAAKGKASSTMMMKLEGARQAAEIKGVAGKSYTVIKSPMMGAKASNWLFMKPAAGAAASNELLALQIQNGTGNLSGLVGKTYTISKAPMVAGNATGNWILLQPAKATAAKAAVGGAAAAKSKAAISTTKAAKTTTAAKSATAAKSGSSALAGKSSAVSATAGNGGGLIWNGTGWKLGTGLGLGAWGPVILVGVVAATSVGVYNYLKNRAEDAEEAE
ncbi:MAG: hypothetical protein HQL69_19490 [Magnetococcales bacterium]|nr:hypothetical protein [Magnetococcales bacterium]